MITPAELFNLFNESKIDDRYINRINALKAKDFNTEIIENGVEQAINVIQKEKGNSFVIYGEPQSGKTELMIALTCKLLDCGFRTIFIVVNDNTELENQNYKRFLKAAQLNPTPLRDYQLEDLLPKQLKNDVPRVVFCRKNSKRLQSLITNARHFKNRVVIDDEADFATPNTNINKKDKESTSIHKYLGQLVRLEDEGIYIGVTATPGRLDLNNTFLNKSEHWVFLDSHSKYKGRDFFFPDNVEEAYERYILKILPEEYDDPKFLRHAILRFMLRSCFLNYPSIEPKGFSMLIHTAGRIRDHEDDKKVVDSVIDRIKNHDERIWKELINIANELFNKEEEVQSILEYLWRFKGMNQVLILNSKKKDSENVLKACNPDVLFTFAIGGNIVSRGLTFNRLLSFFFSRNVKGKMQQNTYIQRARMFGSREYSNHFELCVPGTIFERWKDVFDDHELSLRFAKSGDYAHVESEFNRAVDSSAIDKEYVQKETRERAIGKIFELNENLEQRILSFDKSISVVDFISNLIEEGLLTFEHFPKTMLTYITEKSNESGSDQILIFENPNIQTKSIYSGRNLSDWNDSKLMRSRGGLIAAATKGRKDIFDKNHFIFPVKSIDGSRSRFLYKSTLGHTIIKNYKNYKK